MCTTTRWLGVSDAEERKGIFVPDTTGLLLQEELRNEV